VTATAVLLAGGVGTRVGGDVPKQLLDLGGRPVLAHALATFDAHPGIERILLVMVPGHLDAAREVARPYAKVRAVLEGGATRNDSTRVALAEVADDATVLFHDVARPLVSSRIVSGCLAALASYDAVTTAIASSDTIVELGPDGTMAHVPARSGLRRVQTPQGFRAGLLRSAYELAGADPDFAATDDCGVVLRYLPDVPIAVVEGEERNLKITGPHDLGVAELFLREG
jgi:2-C-methyl-D-erythritol 4-phosphate cytidylyltransferase